MEPTKRYAVRVKEDGEWKYWGSCDSLAHALEAMNQWTSGVEGIEATDRRL
jgi:hypothetical protein